MKICRYIMLFCIAGALFYACSDGGGGDDGDWDVNVVAHPAKASSSKWISKVYEYFPAPGQWINTEGYGTPAAAQSIVGGGDGIVSLGGYGGTIVFGFDHSVLNGDGVDFVIRGNAFESSSEPGAVLVSADVNGNGLPDDQWYLLMPDGYAGAEKEYEIFYSRPSQTETAAAVRWEDNKSGTGWIDVVPAHPQSYFPVFVYEDPSSTAQLWFKGFRLADLTEKTTLNGQDIWTMKPAGRGYADNFSDDYPEIVGGDRDTANSNKFDISKAVDGSGNPVRIRSIDFVRVYTCVNQQAPLIGEGSTEIVGAVSLTVAR